MSYAESLTLLDLMLLLAAVDNRSIAEDLGKRISHIEERLNRAEPDET